MFWGKRTARDPCVHHSQDVWQRERTKPNEEGDTRIYSPAGTLLVQGHALPHQVENSPAMLGAEELA